MGCPNLSSTLSALQSSQQLGHVKEKSDPDGHKIGRSSAACAGLHRTMVTADEAMNGLFPSTAWFQLLLLTLVLVQDTEQWNQHPCVVLSTFLNNDGWRKIFSLLRAFQTRTSRKMLLTWQQPLVLYRGHIHSAHCERGGVLQSTRDLCIVWGILWISNALIFERRRKTPNGTSGKGSPQPAVLTLAADWPSRAASARGCRMDLMPGKQLENEKTR